MKPFHLACIGLGLLVLGFAFGRFVAPDKVVEVEVVKDHVVMQQDLEAHNRIRELTEQVETLKRHTRRETTLVVLPDGTRKRTSTTDTKTDRVTDQRRASEAQEDTRATVKAELVREIVTVREVVRERPTFRLGPLVAVDLRTGSLAYGGVAQARVAGPITVGLLGLSSLQAGAFVSVEF